MDTFRFDPNTPPPMPVSALLYSQTWMRLVYECAPWMTVWMLRDVRRDALRCHHWLGWCVVHYAAIVRWQETNSPLRIVYLHLQ